MNGDTGTARQFMVFGGGAHGESCPSESKKQRKYYRSQHGNYKYSHERFLNEDGFIESPRKWDLERFSAGRKRSEREI
jgi:hypothetical protein